MPVSVPSNRYRLNEDAIVYEVLKTDNGWRISAKTPKRIALDDRRKVINWFREYRSKVRQLNPLWVTIFHVDDTGYSLEVKPMRNARECIEKGQDLQSVWDNEIASRA